MDIESGHSGRGHFLYGPVFENSPTSEQRTFFLPHALLFAESTKNTVY